MDDFESQIMATVRAAEERGETPLAWAMETGRLVQEHGMGIPSLDLAEVLVGSIFPGNNRPALWKFLDRAMVSRLVFPIHVLALLSSRVIPRHKTQPEAYRLYLELLGQYIFSYSSSDGFPYYDKVAKSIDDAMHLSCTFGVQINDMGQTIVWFVFSVIIHLIDNLLEDCGLHLESAEKERTAFANGALDMDIDTKENSNDGRNERHECLHKINLLVASNTLERITANKSAKILLQLAHLNMPESFDCLMRRLEFIKINKPTSQNLLSISHGLTKLSGNVHSAVHEEFRFNHHQFVGVLIDSNPRGLSNHYNPGAGEAACWIAFDILMEKSMDGRQLHAASDVDIITGFTICLQVVNQATWQETFKALWVSALRLVQRERDPFEGPIPHLDARLCILLSITPLAIASILNAEDENKIYDGSGNMKTNNNKGIEGNFTSSRRRGLVSSLQLLGQLIGLLTPPPSVVHAANYAASKAATFVSNFKKGNINFDDICHNDTSVKATGNMLHLIVEACIARKLIDTSVYFWPGYVVTCSTSSTDSTLVEETSWTAFMEGAELSISMTNSLMTTPASSIAQVEKLYNIALNGSEKERSSAAMILCGASLRQGWHIQEHVVRFVVKLLSPPLHSDFSEPGSHLVGYMSMLNSILFGACCIDVVHIISLHGMIPEVAAALVPLCETFGSLVPVSSSKSTSDEPSVYSVFSCAFLFLLRLWKFYSPPQEYGIAERWAHTEMTLDYLLLLHNSRVAAQNSVCLDRNAPVTKSHNISAHPVYIDEFPKLWAWYIQNQACVTSTLSTATQTGACIPNPVHQVANKILNMICQKITKVGSFGNLSAPSTNSISGSSATVGEDAQLMPILPAWEILGSVPFVLEALLTACSIGNISSRELTTGLRDLVDFLPASLAIVLSYFPAEVTRGVWKSVQMNGVDWPSPSANLLSIESEVKEILSSAGVHVKSFNAGGTLPVMLPLPMAALVGLTITFKLDKSMEYIHGVIGPALENCATCSPWPSMPIIAALCEQKVPRWRDFIIFSCVRTPFRQDKDVICQLLKSSFESFLGPPVSSGSHIIMNNGVNGLLGHAFKENGIRLPLSPGFLYIRSCKGFLDTRCVGPEILKLVSSYARELASSGGYSSSGLTRLKSNQVSISSAASRVKEIASIGGTLLCAAGGVRLVQVLYMETLPTFLLARSETKSHCASPTSCVLEGYALAQLLILSGAFVWGIGVFSSKTDVTKASISRRALAVSHHMDFMARSFEGECSLGCDLVTWKSYVCCFTGLLVRFVPTWVRHVKHDTLKKLADGLRGWNECELALSLLQRGGPDAMASVVESIF